MKNIKEQLEEYDIEINILKERIQRLETERQVLLDQLLTSEQVIISKIPTILRNFFIKVGVDTDSKLIGFVNGQYDYDKCMLVILNKELYAKAENAQERLMSIKGVGKTIAQKTLELIDKRM